VVNLAFHIIISLLRLSSKQRKKANLFSFPAFAGGAFHGRFAGYLHQEDTAG
jgi:hypothetical protein